MPKKLIAVAVIIVVVIGLSVAYLLIAGNNPQAKEQDSPGDTKVQQPAPQEPAQSAPGAYVDYQADSIASTSGTKILFFHAPWCPQCRQLDADIKARGLPTGVTIFKVDYDTSQALRQKYSVTIQTTLVKIDDQGDMIKKFVAYDDPTFAAVTKNLLQ